MQLLASPEVQKLSAKAALATEQRIPGLGNGVLQDILRQARLLARRTISTLAEMRYPRGRDTEKDLRGILGGYRSVMSAKPSLACGRTIVKEVIMGGSVYTCPHGQRHPGWGGGVCSPMLSDVFLVYSQCV